MSTQVISDNQIAETAFLIWLDEGQPEGRQDQHWFEARARLEARNAKPVRKRAAPKTTAKTKTPARKTVRKAAAKA